MRLTTGEQIRALRKAHGLTQEQLAEKCGVASFKAVQNWEKDRAFPTTQSLIKLSQIFGVTVDEILKGGNNDIW